MTDRPYTDDQLTAHAVWLLKTHGDSLESLTITETASDHGIDTSQWGGDEWDAYVEAVEKVIHAAPALTEWAIRLGADGLQPSDEHVITLDAGPRSIARIHFAFEPGMDDDMCTALVEGIGAAMAKHLPQDDDR